MPSRDRIVSVILEILKNTLDWQKENGKYVPMASTWINGERWNDVEAFSLDNKKPVNVDVSKFKEVNTEW